MLSNLIFRCKESETNIVSYMTGLFLHDSCFFLLHVKQST